MIPRTKSEIVKTNLENKTSKMTCASSITLAKRQFKNDNILLLTFKMLRARNIKTFLVNLFRNKLYKELPKIPLALILRYFN